LENTGFPRERTGGGEGEDIYLTASYSPVHGDEGGIAGIFVTLVETTRRVRAAASETERPRVLLELEAERCRLEEVFPASAGHSWP